MAEVTQSYRLDNVSFGGYDITADSNASAYTVADQTVKVHTGLAKVGDLVQVDGTKYLVTEVSDKVDGIELAKSSAAKVLAQSKDTKNIIVFPLGSTDSSTPLESHKALNRGGTIDSVAKSTWTTRAVPASRESTDQGVIEYPTDSVVRASTTKEETPTPVKGAGQSAEAAEENGILPFAKFVGTLAFRRLLEGSLKETSNESVHMYLRSMMDRFYHQLYYIPNLKNNYSIVVKPETLFVKTPSCNLLFPNMKFSIGYSRPFKQEPTRLVHVTDPMAAMTGTDSQEPISLYSFMFVEDRNDGVVMKDGLPVRSNFVDSLSSGHTNLTDRTRPLINITNYEQHHGIRCASVNRGSDIYLYLASKEKTSEDMSYADIQSVPPDSNTLLGVGKTLGRLAQYELDRERYIARTGSATTYFNPYIVPGFPMTSIETTSDGLNIYGYVTSVVHDLSEHEWSTTVSFNCVHDDLEESPGAFPIIESEYTETLDKTYKDMLGDNITPITNEEMPSLVAEYGNDKNYITQSYRKIWRETPSLESFLKDIADGAELIEANGYTWIKNAEGSMFFNEDVQARLREYTEQIMVTHRAFHADDVR